VCVKIEERERERTEGEEMGKWDRLSRILVLIVSYVNVKTAKCKTRYLRW
jgi:hypothetical protein